MVDALTSKDDEGRSSLRKASGRWQATFEPGISEWGNPFRWKIGTSLPELNRVIEGNLAKWNISVARGKENNCRLQITNRQSLRWLAARNLWFAHSPSSGERTGKSSNSVDYFSVEFSREKLNGIQGYKSAMYAESWKINAFQTLVRLSREKIYNFPSKSRWKAAPKKVIALYAKRVIALQHLSWVPRVSWNPVGIRRDYAAKLNTFDDR